LHDYFDGQNSLEPGNGKGKEEISYEIGGKNIVLVVYKGKVKIGDKKIDYCCLPHPNRPLPKGVRIKAWDYCFPKVES
jgi:hypothetical protein